MAEISAALVRELRDKTGAGMMDCKRALAETGGDLEAAIDWLRKKGLAAAAKKAGRTAAEGLVGVSTGDDRAAIVEVNAETDFVARNETFQAFVETCAALALEAGGNVEALKALAYPGGGGTVADELTRLIATIGENMTIRRTDIVFAPAGGSVATYVHAPLKPSLGRIGVLVSLFGGTPESRATLGRQLAMHIAAARPEYLDVASVDPIALARERAVLAEQARASGKPEPIIEKMVEGRLRKFYEEVALLEQVWVHDGESRVKDVIAKAGVTITCFVRYQLGEGIEKDEKDFAAEVAAAAR
ncbi:MAG: translation elongation factor Ts [Elioraea sp.]|nr:translation elongation factor Ts [Elioraea sp.]